MKIPERTEDALVELKGLGELVTASEWKRAAIVWAFTEDRKPGRNSSTSGRMSAAELAEQGISGLTSKQTVIKYRKAWRRAIEDGFAIDVKRGDLIDLPNVEWQPYYNPPIPNLNNRQSGGKKHGALEKWDEFLWDTEKINESQRIVKMNDIMWETLDGLPGIEGQMLIRIGQSILDFVGDENKVRGIARLMHSVIEFASAYKTQQRAGNS